MNDQTEAREIWQCLEKAIARFNKGSDRETLLCPGEPPEKYWQAAGERAIAHRMAFYLEDELLRTPTVSNVALLAVDCEYNRHRGAPKAMHVKAELKKIVTEARKRKWADLDEDGFYVFSVAPDIILHQWRNSDERNLLVVELKKRSNPEKPTYDALKLHLFTSPKEDDSGYGYILGARVVAEDNCKPEDRHLRIEDKYWHGERQPY